MLFALGLGESVVAVTHECDFPPEAPERAHLTRSVIPEGLPAAAIDAAVRERTEAGQALYELDEEVLAELEPDLIVTQALCEVCAVSVDDVRAVAGRLPSRPSVISLDPRTLGEVLGDVRTLAQVTDSKDAGVDLVSDAADRIDCVKLAVRGADRPRVAALEWLDPPFVGGHWVPQMIELAGGEDLLGLPGEKSRTATWDEIRASEPDVVVSMPCGYYADRCASEALAHRGEIDSLGARTVVAVDAAAYFSRPGPRLVDGLEQLGHVLHPDRVDPPAAGRIVPVG
jgi:iron complex transport system substrate-binding protein